MNALPSLHGWHSFKVVTTLHLLAKSLEEQDHPVLPNIRLENIKSARRWCSRHLVNWIPYCDEFLRILEESFYMMSWAVKLDYCLTVFINNIKFKVHIRFDFDKPLRGTSLSLSIRAVFSNYFSFFLRFDRVEIYQRCSNSGFWYLYITVERLFDRKAAKLLQMIQSCFVIFHNVV